MPVFPTWDSIIYTDPVLPMRISFPPNLGMLVVGPGGPVGRSPGLTTGGTWPWSLPTPVGTEPGATSVGAVTRNVTGLEDPQVAVYLEKITGELNADKQYQLLSKLDTLLTQDLPTLPLFQAPVSLVQQADIVNVSESAGSAGPLWDAEDWVVELASANS
jgi:ABC-type transport system substrate-binding protein